MNADGKVLRLPFGVPPACGPCGSKWQKLPPGNWSISRDIFLRILLFNSSSVKLSLQRSSYEYRKLWCAEIVRSVLSSLFLDQNNSVKIRILDTLTQNKTKLEAMNIVSVFIAGSFWRQLITFIN